MRLSQIIKNSSLTILIFFVSCAVNAQSISDNKKIIELIDESVKKNNSNENTINPRKTDEITEANSPTTNSSIVAKEVAKKTKKKSTNRLKNKKNSQKKSKKIHKIIRKKIIKRIYVTKDEPQNQKAKDDEINQQLPKETPQIDADLENFKNNRLTNYQEVSGNYLIEAELRDNCDRLTGTQCFRGDKFFQEPYFHYTILTIFNHKVIIEQFYEGNVKDRDFIKVVDGEYLLYTKNQNKIFLIVKNGIVNELILLNGDLSKETKIENKCMYSDKLYAHHRLYQSREIDKMNIFYSSTENFKGLVEGLIFSEKYQPKNFYMIFKTPNREFRPAQNLNLCKIGDEIQAIEKNYTKSECSRKFRCTMKTLESYGSDGFSVRDQNFSFFDYYENNMQISLSIDQINGLINEVNKLSGEDKKNLRSRCFNDKNLDLISCSKSENCEDYLVVDNCEVNYFYDQDKIGFKNK